MFKAFIGVLFVSLSTALVAGPSVEEQLAELQNELTQLKENQVAIARHIGLGALVRPEQIAIGSGITLGDENAEFVMMEFTDLHCAFCARFHDEIFPELKVGLIEEGKVLFISREFPLTNIHPNAPFAAMMLRCAAQQDKYLEAKSMLFSVRSEFDREFVDSFTDIMSLDSDNYNACMDDDEVHNQVAESMAYGQMLGISATPTFVIGRKSNNMITDYEVVTGMVSQSRLKQIIATIKEK